MILALLMFILLLCTVPALGADDASVAPNGKIRGIETEDAITVYAGEQPVLRYNKTLVPAPEGINPVYGRSGYIHPVWSPSGKVVTGDFAPDHPHQHALFFAYVNTSFAGQKTDFWNQVKKTGDISHRRVISLENGDGFSQFQVELAHDALLTQPSDGEPSNADGRTDADAGADGARRVTVLLDTWTVRVDAADDGLYRFDIDSVQRCATDSPLVIHQFHYGAMGLRGANAWYRDDSARAFRDWQQRTNSDPGRAGSDPPGLDVMGHDFLTNEGKRRHDGNHTPARWVSIYGQYAAQATAQAAAQAAAQATAGEQASEAAAPVAGIAVLSHPSNFRAPQPVRLHPDKPYFCFAPMVQGQYEITPAKPLRSRYRFIIHDNPPDAQQLDRQYDVYAR